MEGAKMPSRSLTRYRAGSLSGIVRRASTKSIYPRETRLVIEAGRTESAAVTQAVREWIVPALVREYLAERASASASSKTVMQKLDTEPLGKEQRASPAPSQ